MTYRLVQPCKEKKWGVAIFDEDKKYYRQSK